MSAPKGQTLHERNREILQEGIFGDTAVGAYDAAVDMDSRLKGVEVVAHEGRPRARFARAVPNWELPLKVPNHQLGLYSHHSGLSIALVALAQDVEKVPGAPRYFGEKIGLEEDEPLDPYNFYAFGLLRELGRASDFFHYEHQQGKYVETQQVDARALPVASMSVAKMLQPGTERFMMKRWEELSIAQGVDTYDELVAKQFRATRETTIEAYADGFAADILRQHPELRTIA
jgi:hypothetical protein